MLGFKASERCVEVRFTALGVVIPLVFAMVWWLRDEGTACPQSNVRLESYLVT